MKEISEGGGRGSEVIELARSRSKLSGLRRFLLINFHTPTTGTTCPP